jgi:hypothetical protein
MGARGPRWVLCQGATHRDAPADALRIGVGSGDWNGVTVDIEGLESRMTGTLAPGLHDLMTLASFVLAADCATSRGTLTAVDNGASWRREFHLVVPVADPERWRQPDLIRALESTLGFLSDDSWHFHFEPRSDRTVPAQIRFAPPADGRTFASWDQVDDVLLFSGGMDSFSGAVDACLGERRRPLLVSHRSSSKIGKVQRDLVDALRALPEGCSPWYLAIDVHRRTRALREEESQRTRSFLFAAIAGAVSWLAGQRRLTFHENGIIALNLPITAQLQGARGTRTVHPRVLEGFARILGLVAGQDFEVKNPYQWRTRAEVAANLRDRGVAELLKLTRSCASVRNATNMHPFCGVCSQCVDRQFAVRAAGLLGKEPEEMYAVQLFADPLVEDRDVQLAVSYVLAAGTFSQLTGRRELVSRYGEVLDATDALARQWEITPEVALDRLVDLHRRQGKMVIEVLGQELARQTPKLLDGAHHPATLLSRCIIQGLTAARRTFEVEGPNTDGAEEDAAAMPATADPKPPLLGLAPGEVLPSNVFYPVGDGWLVGMEGAAAVVVKESAGLSLIRTLLRHPHRTFRALALEAATAENPDVVGSDHAVSELSGAGAQTSPSSFEVFDEAAVSAIKAKIADLRQEEDEAEENCDRRGAEAARAQREALEERLLKDLGLGGRRDQVPPEVEKARGRVRKAIDRTLKDIAKVNLPLKKHLANTISLGFDVTYKPDGARVWVTDR